MPGQVPVLPRDDFAQVTSIFSGVRVLRPPQPLAMRCTCVSTTTPSGCPEGDPEDDVGRLASDPRQLHQLAERPRHLAPVVAAQRLRQPHERLGLHGGRTPASRPGARRPAVRDRERVRRRVAREEGRRGLVDRDVGGLRAQHGRHDELERRGVDELAVRRGVLLGEAGQRLRGEGDGARARRSRRSFAPRGGAVLVFSVTGAS